MPMAFEASGDKNETCCVLVSDGFWFTNMVLVGSSANKHPDSIDGALPLPRQSIAPSALPQPVWSLPAMVQHFMWFKSHTL